MTIKQLGGVFGRNPTFNDVTIEGELTFDGDIDINSDLKIDGDLVVTGGMTVDTSTLVVDDANNRVGIGTTTPQDLLHITLPSGVNGDIIALGRAANSYQFHLGMTSDSMFYIADNGSDIKVGFPYLGGITFNGDTAAANALDDYEEGAWEPNLLNGTSITYTTTPTGNYTKIGNMVYVTASIDVSNSDTADASALTIGGLPFSAINDTMTFTLGRYRSFLATKGAVVLGAAANASFIQLFESNNDFILYSEIGSSGILYFSGSYLT